MATKTQLHNVLKSKPKFTYEFAGEKHELDELIITVGMSKGKNSEGKHFPTYMTTIGKYKVDVKFRKDFVLDGIPTELPKNNFSMILYLGEDGNNSFSTSANQNQNNGNLYETTVLWVGSALQIKEFETPANIPNKSKKLF